MDFYYLSLLRGFSVPRASHFHKENPRPNHIPYR